MDKKPRILSITSDILERFCKPSIVEGILGDLEESYFQNKKLKGGLRTNIIHLLQVVGFLGVFRIKGWLEYGGVGLVILNKPVMLCHIFMYYHKKEIFLLKTQIINCEKNAISFTHIWFGIRPFIPNNSQRVSP